MPYSISQFQETPNPNAVKCILDRPIRSKALGPASYRSADSASDDPVASALFTIPGVMGLLINEDWITVSKAADADWKKIKACVRDILARLE